jgi:tetratricopeptide (TPR) repeat protein
VSHTRTKKNEEDQARLVKLNEDQMKLNNAILLELDPLVSECFYCKKRHSIFSKKLPIHPTDRAIVIQDMKDRFGGFYEDLGEELEESLKSITIRCCDKCWRSKVAEVGLTKATGKKLVDAGNVGGYIKNANECFNLGKFREALEKISCAEELSLKSLDTDLGYEAHELAGDCQSELGNREEAIRELSLALELFEGTPISVGSATPWGVLYTLKKGWSRGDKLSELNMKIQKLRDELGADRS